MITINYNGDHSRVAQAVIEANKLLQDEKFFEEIGAHPRFDLTEATSVQISSSIKNCTAQMTIEFYTTLNPWSRANAYDDPEHPLVIHLNTRKLNRTVASICATLIHEAIHAADAIDHQLSYAHGDNDATGKENTAPYWIDSLAYKIVSGGDIQPQEFQHDSMSNDKPDK